MASGDVCYVCPMLATALILSAGLAHAQSTTVLVAPFEATHPEAAGLAAMLPDFMNQQLGARRDISIISIDEVGDIAETSARTYAESCPAGEFVGCTFVLAEAGGAQLALTGQVTAYDNNTMVEVHLVDTASAEELVIFEVHYGPGDDLIFAEGIARVVQAAMRGDVGQSVDLRNFARPEESTLDIARANADLNQLDQETGGASTLDERDEGILTQDEYTMDDFADDMNSEGAKPWDRLGMGPREFLRYKNAGIPLYEWRELALGRKGQLIMRGGIGFGRNPTYGAYYGRLALSAQTLEVAEIYAWQTAQNGSGIVGGGSLGFGITPNLEFAIQAGVGSGRFQVDIHRITEGEFSSPQPPSDYPNLARYVGPQIIYAFLPTSSFRPLIGGFVTAWMGTGVDNHILPIFELPNGGDPSVTNFSAPISMVAGGIGGFEVKMGSNVDLWVHVPVGAVVTTFNAPSTYEMGGGILTDTDAPPEQGVASSGVHVGIQVRAFGAKANTSASRTVY